LQFFYTQLTEFKKNAGEDKFRKIYDLDKQLETKWVKRVLMIEAQTYIVLLSEEKIDEKWQVAHIEMKIRAVIRSFSGVQKLLNECLK
jgi:hypothetical protein